MISQSVSTALCWNLLSSDTPPFLPQSSIKTLLQNFKIFSNLQFPFRSLYKQIENANENSWIEKHLITFHQPLRSLRQVAQSRTAEVSFSLALQNRNVGHAGASPHFGPPAQQ